MDDALPVLGLAVGGFVLAAALWAFGSHMEEQYNKRVEFEKTAPCSYFADYTIDGLPARCLKEFGVTER